ncbi:unnamed protein product [Cyprideis torosa]|uniref:Uncharacterized protein n=1 Tax=Cyprideis torosa TaxID=163714 RepID=A0A7R8WZT8_9CRUS|nr:unnamed protein product [Cyprideis torosa]CAG0910498.1 unnamed protein product [Cyprideis torosa]
MRLLESGEKISHMFRAAKVSGLDSTEGLLLFGKEHYYFVEGFTLLKTREIRDIDHLPVNLHEPIVPSCGTPISSSRNKKAMSRCGEPRLCHKFAYEDIREVHRRRYLLQGIALEVFNADGRNYLLAFPRGVRNKVYQK